MYIVRFYWFGSIATATGAFSIVLNSAGMVIETLGQDVYNQLSAGIMITVGLLHSRSINVKHILIRKINQLHTYTMF